MSCASKRKPTFSSQTRTIELGPKTPASSVKSTLYIQRVWSSQQKRGISPEFECMKNLLICINV